MTPIEERRARPILLVEDNPQDRKATERAFRKSNCQNPIYQCKNGDEALDYLHRRGEYADPEKAPRPGVILLDLNMPRTSGHDVLADIKQDAELRDIPVIVLTTSTDDRDISACYAAGGRCCITRRQCVGASPPLISGRSVRWNPFRLGESERSQSVECLTLDQGLDLLILEPARRELDP